MATSQLAISLTTVMSGISATTVEAGVAIGGAAIAALPLVLLAVGWRRVLLSFSGSRGLGTVTRVERTGPRTARAQVGFRTADGREASVRLGVPPRTRAGDRLDIRYDEARPEFATNRSAPAVVLHFLLPVGALAAVGLAGVAGTLYTTSAGGFDAFSNGYAVVVLVVLALYAFFVGCLRYSESSPRDPEVSGSAATAVPGSSVTGAILAPMLVGVVLLAGAVVLAWG